MLKKIKKTLLFAQSRLVFQMKKGRVEGFALPDEVDEIFKRESKDLTVNMITMAKEALNRFLVNGRQTLETEYSEGKVDTALRTTKLEELEKLAGEYHAKLDAKLIDLTAEKAGVLTARKKEMLSEVQRQLLEAANEK